MNTNFADYENDTFENKGQVTFKSKKAKTDRKRQHRAKRQQKRSMF